MITNMNNNLEFIEDYHIYVLDGIPIPSVSDIIKFVFPDKYTNIPEKILKEAGEFGTNMHKVIEEYEKQEYQNLTITQETLLEDYIQLKKDNNLEVIGAEQMIHYKDLYAGRYDMLAIKNNPAKQTDQLAKHDNKTYLIDLKFTAEFDYKWLQLQLSLYNRVVKADKLGCYHIPRKGFSQFIEIEELKESELDEILSRYRADRERNKVDPFGEQIV